MKTYILDKNGEPVLEKDIEKWGSWFASDTSRIVRVEKVGKSRVSTVFLGLDHAFGGGTPQLWETMVFGGPLDGVQTRCGGGRRQAEIMHEAMVERAHKAKDEGYKK